MYVRFCFASVKTLNEHTRIWRCMTPHVKSYTVSMSGEANVLQLDSEQS